MISKKETIININSSSLKGDITFFIQSKTNIVSFSLSVSFHDEIVFHQDVKVNGLEYLFHFQIEHPILWSINHPNLYQYRLVIDDSKEKEIIEDDFGIRNISTKGKYVCINNVPIFVKGYIRGATAHEHSNNINVSEEEFYRKNILTAKKFGFNTVRFHSQIPSETFFKVADEEGLLVHIEMRPPHDIYNNLEEMIHSKNDFISEEFISHTINSLYNHPSLFVYCLGNEIRNLKDSKIVLEIGEEIKKKDPTRLYLDTCAWGENGRPLVDIDVQHLSYYFPFGKHNGMYDDVKNLMLGDFNKGKEISFHVPLFAHEVCHYTALRDFQSLKEKFTANHISVPWWVDEELKLIHRQGYDDIYSEMYQASKYWQLNCWKIAYEAMRNSALLGGFHFLQFADTDVYENSNGVVDCFDDINAITPEQFLEFNSDIIVTATINKFNYFANENIVLPVYISRFDELDLKQCELHCEIKINDKSIRKTIPNIDLSQHDHYSIYQIKETLPNVNIMSEGKINLSIYSHQQQVCHNHYSIYVYPKQAKISYDDFVHYQNKDVVITDDIARCLSALKEGKKVCLVYRSDFTRHVKHKNMPLPEYAFKASWNRFKPVIWDRGTNFGGIINLNNISKITKYGFVHSYIGNNYCCLCEDSDKIIIENNRLKVTNLISGIDKCNRDRFDAYKGSFNLPELMEDRTLRNFSHLFELKVGEGKLLVTGLNLLGLDENEPSSNYMAHFILNYLSSDDFMPDTNNSYADFVSYLKENAKNPVKERMMTQFWCLDEEPVESKKYWEESRKYLIDK